MTSTQAIRIAALVLALAPFTLPAAAESAAAVMTHAAGPWGSGESAFRSIRDGMTARDVLATLGEPARRMRFPLSKTTAWDYQFRDTWGYDADFSVIMNDDGMVVGKFVARHDGG